MATVLYILLALGVLLLMILIHEFGHYVVGRMLNFKITEFSVGFGKVLFSKRNKRGEIISLRLIPLGGFCAFEGEDENNPNNPDSFNNQAPWKRVLVFLAGVTFNFAAAVIFSAILLCTVGYDIPQAKKDIQFNSTEITDYIDGSYYTTLTDSEQMLQEGDVILSIDGKTIDFAFGTTYPEEQEKAFAAMKLHFAQAVGDKTGEEAKLAEKTAFENYFDYTMAVVRRDGKEVEVKLAFYRIEKYDTVDGEKIALTNENGDVLTDGDGNTIYQTSYYYGWNSVETAAYVHSFTEAVERAVPFTFGLSWVVLESLWQMVTFQLDIGSIAVLLQLFQRLQHMLKQTS